MFKLALVAGHYLGTAGKNCPKTLDPNATKEWWLNDRIADKIEAILADYDGIQILRIDDTTGKTDVPLTSRPAKANSWGADFYLSIHHNAATKIFSGGGIAAYVCPNASAKSVEWQKALYKAAINYTNLKGDRAEPLAVASHYETCKTTMPAVLMECGFMNSTVDCPIILTEEFADDIANAFAEVIIDKVGLKKKAKKQTYSKPSVKVNITMPVLSKGMRHESVKTLQRILNALGFTDAQEKPLAVDGSFGPATCYAFNNFQDQTIGLDVDGICGEQSWKALLNAI